MTDTSIPQHSGVDAYADGDADIADIADIHTSAGAPGDAHYPPTVELNAVESDPEPAPAEPAQPAADAEEPLALRSTAVSDVGTVRSNNQDSAFAGSRLVSVCDGMGGHAGGDTASTIAIRSLAHIEQSDAGSSVEAVASMMDTSVLAAHDAIVGKAKRERSLAGMGTTVTAVALVSGHWVCAHIGDSRAYMLRDGKLRRMTHDHSYVQHLIDTGRITEAEARNHPQRNVVMRVLGDFDIDPRPDVGIFEARPGDRWLLCSDGLCGVLEDSTIEEVMDAIAAPEECAQRLVAMSLKAGSTDNVTAVIGDALPVSALSTVDEAAMAGAGEPVEPPRQTPLVGGAASSNLEAIADIVKAPVASTPALRLGKGSPAQRAAELTHRTHAQHAALPEIEDPITATMPRITVQPTGSPSNEDAANAGASHGAHAAGRSSAADSGEIPAAAEGASESVHAQNSHAQSDQAAAHTQDFEVQHRNEGHRQQESAGAGDGFAGGATGVPVPAVPLPAAIEPESDSAAAPVPVEPNVPDSAQFNRDGASGAEFSGHDAAVLEPMPPAIQPAAASAQAATPVPALADERTSLDDEITAADGDMMPPAPAHADFVEAIAGSNEPPAPGAGLSRASDSTPNHATRNRSARQGKGRGAHAAHVADVSTAPIPTAPELEEAPKLHVAQPSAVREEIGEKVDLDTSEIPVVKKRDGRITADPNDPDVAMAIRRKQHHAKQIVRKRKSRARMYAAIAAAVLLVAVLFGAAGAYHWSQTKYFLGEANGKVAIYQGVNTNLFGAGLSHEVETTDIKVKDLPQSWNDQIGEGIAVDSLDGAHEHVALIKKEIKALKASKDKESAERSAHGSSEGQDDTSKPAPDDPNAATPDGSAAR